MQIKLNNVLVDNQDKALKFYTETLGFVKKFDIPMGEFRWLTVVSKDRDDLELVLEPLGFEPAKTFQAALEILLTETSHCLRSKSSDSQQIQTFDSLS